MKIKTKKIINKITAIAGTALMAMSGAFAAVNLATVKNTFITNGNFNAYVVVGSGSWNTAITWNNPTGLAQDIAGSIEVASAFAQSAVTAGATSGSAILERNVSPGALASTGIAEAIELQAYALTETFGPDTSGFSWLVNKSIQDGDGNEIAKALSYLTVPSTKFRVTEEGGVLRVADAGLIYNLTFDNPVNTTASNIPMPDGVDYQVISIERTGINTNVTLGALSNFITGMNTVNEIGNSGVTFQVVAASQDAIKIVIRDPAGGILVQDKWWTKANIGTSNTKYESSDFGITIQLNALTVLIDGTVEANIGWTTGTIKLVDGQVSSTYPNWTVKIGEPVVWSDGMPKNVTSIAFEYKKPSGVSALYLNPGDEISFFDNLFSIYHKGIKINSTNEREATISVSTFNTNEPEIAYVDENGTQRTIDLTMPSSLNFNVAGIANIPDTWLDGQTYELTCTGASGTIQNLGTNEIVPITDDTPVELGVNLNLSYTATVNFDWEPNQGGSGSCNGSPVTVRIDKVVSNAGNPINNSLIWNRGSETNGTDGYLTLVEPGASGVNITVNYKAGSGEFENITAGTQKVIDSVDKAYYTRYGTLLTRAASTEVTIQYPEARRQAYVSVGREAATQFVLNQGEYNADLDVTLTSAAGESVVVNKIALGLAKLDTEVSTAALDKPVILIGGPSVNRLVRDLVTANKTRAASEYVADRAYVQLIENAFNNKAALLIAGFAGKDTRLAAQVVASQVLGFDVLAGGFSGTGITLNTGVTTYTSVTVV